MHGTLILFFLSIPVAKPEFKLELKNRSVRVGEMVVLKCKLKTTDIPPTITWYKDGVVIPHGHTFYKIHLFRHSSRLKIRRIRLEDAGKYTCHVSNFITNVSTHSWLYFQPKSQAGKNLTRKKRLSFALAFSSFCTGSHLVWTVFRQSRFKETLCRWLKWFQICFLTLWLRALTQNISAFMLTAWCVWISK